MKIPNTLRSCFLLSILAAPLLTFAQQAPLPSLQTRPLYGNAAQSAAAHSQVNPSNDARVLDFAERFKTTLQQVRDSNPAVVPQILDKSGAVSRLQQRAAGRVDVRMRHNTGTPRFIEAVKLESAAAGVAGSNGERDLATARNFLRNNKELLRLTDPDNELRLQKNDLDQIERRHLRFTQKHNGIPVWPAEIGIHLDRAGNVYLMTGAYVPTPVIALSRPNITPEDAIRRGHVHVPAGERHTEPELIIYAPGERTPRLAWKLEVITPLDNNWMVVVDAWDGRILAGYDQVATENVAGSGVDLLGQTRALNVWHQGGSYFLVDTSKQMFDPSSQPPSPVTTRGALIFLDGQNQPPTSNVTETPPVFDIVATSPNGFNIPQTVSAAFNVSLSYDYYLARFQRNSFDNQGSNVYVQCRIGQGWPNADMSFAGGKMRFGDADLYAAGLDVVAHEFTHAVTGSTSSLIYQNQSGALNESFSDIFGEMAEFYAFGNNDWVIGTSLQSIVYKRSLMNPSDFSSGGMPYPSKMSEFLNTSGDAGGVHFNSSIHNHCFYLLAEGLQGGIGRADAEKIFFRSLTIYLMQNSAFIDARLAAVRAAKDLFGDSSVQAQRTAAAFDAVEIFDSGGSPPPPDTPPVSAADSTLFIYGNTTNGFALARREAGLGDPVQGSFLGNEFAFPRPPSANGAGDLAIYVTSDNDCSLVRTDAQGESRVGVPGLVNSVAMSPDRSLFGFVLRGQNGQPDNSITVIDVDTPGSQPVTYTLVAPGNDGGTNGTIVFADAMAFTANGRYLIYDALDSLVANGQQIGVFSIYALELATGNIQSLVQPIREYNIGNPSLSKTNDNFMAFEAVSIANGQSTILAIDLNSGTASVVGNSDIIAFPTYTGADDGIIFGVSNPQGAPATGISLVLQGLAQDRQTPVGDLLLWLQDGGYPFIYRRGPYQGPPVVPATTRFANISTRMRVLTGQNVLIGGFIVTGAEPKRVIMRGIGPSLGGVGTTLVNPTLELRDGSTLVASNNNWRDTQQAEIEATGIPPSNDLESAIVQTLSAGAYTVILSDNTGASGVGLVEVYDLGPEANSKLGNISTRGFVDTGDNVMIGGLIVRVGQDSGIARVVIRAIGPSLQGVSGPLLDPTLELHNSDGATIAANDNWKLRPDGTSQQAEIEATTIPPADDRESAIFSVLAPDNYTAIVRGKDGTTGIAVVEAYSLQ